MKINQYKNIYRTFKGKEDKSEENQPKKSFAELLQTIDFDKKPKPKTSLLDAIRRKEAEEGAEKISADLSLNIDA